MLKITSLETAPRILKDIEAYKMLERADAALIRLTIKPGEKVDLHVNDFDVAFYIMQGAPTVLTDTESYTPSTHSVIEIPSGTQRGVQNHGTEDVIMLVVKFLAGS